MPIFGQNFQLRSALISDIATRWEVSPIWACSARRVLSEYHSHTPGSFLELDPSPLDGVSGSECVRCIKSFKFDFKLRLFVNFAKFEERQREYERCRVIYKYAIGLFSSKNNRNIFMDLLIVLYWAFLHLSELDVLIFVWCCWESIFCVNHNKFNLWYFNFMNRKFVGSFILKPSRLKNLFLV